jgi:hypothetical protein
MRKLFILFSALTFINSAKAVTPKDSDFGLGLMVGSIVAATGKYWISNREAIDFGVGFIGSPWSVIYADYLFHIPGVFGSGTKFGRETSLYFGGGGGLGIWSKNDHCGHWKCDRDPEPDDSGTGVFLRGLVGFEWYPLHTRFGVFGEVGPSIMITPDTSSAPDIGVGGRYYF